MAANSRKCPSAIGHAVQVETLNPRGVGILRKVSWEAGVKAAFGEDEKSLPVIRGAVIVEVQINLGQEVVVGAFPILLLSGSP
jgi:hypothetical protein